jgi:hypothetical protein
MQVMYKIVLVRLSSYCTLIPHYCLTDLTVDSNDITVLVSGEQKHYFHLWGLQKPLVAFATRNLFRPHSWKQWFFTLLPLHSNTTESTIPWIWGQSDFWQDASLGMVLGKRTCRRCHKSIDWHDSEAWPTPVPWTHLGKSAADTAPASWHRTSWRLASRPADDTNMC